MRVFAVIPTWNGREATLGCLAALARSTHPADAIVVDNGSQDGTVEAVRRAGARAIALEKNTGFAAATNRGIEDARARGADAFLLINNDARIAPDALARLVAALEADRAVALASPTIVDERGRVWYGGGSFVKPIALVRHERRSRPRDAGALARRVSFAPLTCALVSRAAIDRVGALDERFFLYYEDVDLALRLARERLAIVHVPAARAVHAGALTTRRRPVDRFARETESLLALLAKHYSPRERAAALLALALHHAPKRAVLAIARGEPAFLLGILRGVGWYLGGVRGAAAPRRRSAPRSGRARAR